MNIPETIKNTLEILQKAGYEAYIVGGCVRDLLRNAEPKDWDLTTNAKPEQIEAVFDAAGFKTFYENAFGTVTVLTNSEKKCLKNIEITPFRSEAKYSDKRHPDSVKFVKSLKQDLARRDFTINALALEIKDSKLKTIDLFEGQKDLQEKIIRAVGKPEERFQEDALRMMRAVRFAVCLDDTPWPASNASGVASAGWKIEPKTFQAIAKNAKLLNYIAKERIKDELVKIIMSKNGSAGIELLRELGLLQSIIPELLEGYGNSQNKHHIYEIYQHNLLSLEYACKKDFSLEVRLASLLHDIAKPKTKRGEGPNATFYGHEIVGAKMTKKILETLKFSKKDVEKITKLVRYHLFYYNAGEVGESSVRRLLRNVGPELVEELLQVRMSDRIGSGVPKAEPYKLRHLKYLFEKVAKDPISPKMLKVNGQDIMQILQIKPGPKVGQILSVILSYVLSEPQKNDRAFLIEEIKRLGNFPDTELAKLAKSAKTEVEQVETKQDQMTKSKYWVT
ncbi:MAG: HD domain-containing protein [Candidatus Pacebacteria bacterium]|nr:HD domain-containing protein [Candidatus Paceibacterota bacterium]